MRVIVRGVAFVLTMAFVLLMAWLPHPPHTPLERFDKVQHMAAFATLALLASWAFPRAPLARVAERLSFLGALVEVVQNMPSVQRDCDVYDWIADTCAIIAALGLVALVRKRASSDEA